MTFAFASKDEGESWARAARCVGIKRRRARLAPLPEARRAICKPHQARRSINEVSLDGQRSCGEALSARCDVLDEGLLPEALAFIISRPWHNRSPGNRQRKKGLSFTAPLRCAWRMHRILAIAKFILQALEAVNSCLQMSCCSLYAVCLWCRSIGAEVGLSALPLVSKPPFEAQPPIFSGVVPDS